jgi:hypothetical protein
MLKAGMVKAVKLLYIFLSLDGRKGELRFNPGLLHFARNDTLAAAKLSAGFGIIQSVVNQLLKKNIELIVAGHWACAAIG